MGCIEKSTVRYRPWEVIFYGKEDELMNIIRNYRARIAHYAYIFHNKDTYDDDTDDHKKGELKKPHWHILLDFYDGHTFTRLVKMWSTLTDKPRVEHIVDRQAKFEYLTHKGYPDKYQYSSELVKSDNVSYYLEICKRGDGKDKDNLAVQIVNDILKGCSPFTLLSRYGRDFVIHRDAYMDMANAITDWNRTHSSRYAPCDDDDDSIIPFE